jgi:hypothetical protein
VHGLPPSCLSAPSCTSTVSCCAEKRARPARSQLRSLDSVAAQRMEASTESTDDVLAESEARAEALRGENRTLQRLLADNEALMARVVEDMQSLGTRVAVGGGDAGDTDEAAVLREMVGMLQEENESLRGGSGGSVQVRADEGAAPQPTPSHRNRVVAVYSHGHTDAVRARESRVPLVVHGSVFLSASRCG